MTDTMTHYSNLLTTLPTKLYSAAFPSPDESPSSQDLMILVSTIAVMWAAIFSVLHRYLHPYAMRQQWLTDAMGREYDRVGLSMCKALRVKWTRQRYTEIMLNDWPKMQGIYLQHFIGGALCLPAVLGYTDSWAANLACLGVLSEMGWEMSDMADIVITRSTAIDGKERVPDTLVMIMSIHHSMTLTLGLPLVMKYRQLRTLHLLTFNLQWAAALAISANEYCKTLDLKNQKQLWTFRIVNGICFGIMAWMRGIYWLFLCGKLHMRLYEDEEYTMMCVGVVIYTLITGFNVMLCIYPFGKKMLKFGPRSKEMGLVDMDDGEELEDTKKEGGVHPSPSNNSLMEKGDTDN
mmetsp:Transcript_913/g.1312  ORF Transcript_913/g.1312 Transcript_913/m.1312 type:complete len:349 (-) Transcript_913:98-1144(-)